MHPKVGVPTSGSDVAITAPSIDTDDSDDGGGETDTDTDITHLVHGACALRVQALCTSLHRPITASQARPTLMCAFCCTAGSCCYGLVYLLDSW